MRFHSINVPSEWGLVGLTLIFVRPSRRVSIQLMSPASGDKMQVTKLSNVQFCFHSINVPSEWGQGSILNAHYTSNEGFHSINVPSEWGRKMRNRKRLLRFSFHSINVPSEWGRDKALGKVIKNKERLVSIQLMSPASGDFVNQLVSAFCTKFPFN